MTKGDILVKTNGAPAKVYCLDATSCYAVAFDFTDYDNDPETGRPYTIFTAYFQNLQGTYPSEGPEALLALDLFRFQFFDTIESPDYVDASSMVLSAIGNVIVGLGNAWEVDVPVPVVVEPTSDHSEKADAQGRHQGAHSCLRHGEPGSREQQGGHVGQNPAPLL